MSNLYRVVAYPHGERRWGRLLDAGTGGSSLRWVTRSVDEPWTAVTASAVMAERVRAKIGSAMRASDRLIVGNGLEPALLAGETFDTVLADYLIGAVEGFAPYAQAYVLRRLHGVTRGRLCVIGLEPYVPLPEPDDADARSIWAIGRLRDACLLPAGERPYREFPLPWMLDQLTLAGFKIVAARRFPIRYGSRHVHRQLAMCIARARGLADRALGAALEARATCCGAMRCG